MHDHDAAAPAGYPHVHYLTAPLRANSPISRRRLDPRRPAIVYVLGEEVRATTAESRIIVAVTAAIAAVGHHRERARPMATGPRLLGGGDRRLRRPRSTASSAPRALQRDRRIGRLKRRITSFIIQPFLVPSALISSNLERTLRLPRIGRSTLSDQVAGILETRILSGTLPPGSRLPTEHVLTESFGVSRTVVRDALRVLVARGLVEVRRGTGTIVKPSSVDAYSSAAATLLLRSGLTIGDVFEARAALEGQLALIAAANHTAEQIALARAAFEDFKSAVEDSRDVDVIVRGHVQFHASLVRATNLPALDILLGPIQQMMLATSVAARGVDPREPRAWRVPVHLRLLEAVESREPAAVSEASAKHWSTPLRGRDYREIRGMRLVEMTATPRDLTDFAGGGDATVE